MKKEIRHRAPWWPEEEKFLKTYYFSLGANEVARILQRTVWAVNQRAHRIGLSRTQKKRPWSRKDDRQLIRLIDIKPMSEIAELLGRTNSSVTRRVSLLGIQSHRGRAWSEREESLLVQLYSSQTIRELSRRFGRTEGAIRGRVFRLGLKKSVHWTSELDASLRSLSRSGIEDEIIAAALNTSVVAVRQRRLQLLILIRPARRR